MDIIVRDQNGNKLVSTIVDDQVRMYGVAASRVNGLDVKLSDDNEAIILTISLDEA